MKEYSKIETLYKRDDKFKVKEDILRLPEFGNIKKWYVTEKIHGQNIRIYWNAATQEIKVGGRSTTNTSDLPGDLVKLLLARFTQEKLQDVLGSTEAVIYGEGYGAGINGGSSYSATKEFIMFDVLIGDFWLEPEDIKDVATKLETKYVHEFGEMELADIVSLVKPGFFSPLALATTGKELISEGVIARTVPGLKRRDGSRLMFKLKTHDFTV